MRYLGSCDLQLKLWEALPTKDEMSNSFEISAFHSCFL
jgi:hypothetical protein